jgi:hypothetical protein
VGDVVRVLDTVTAVDALSARMHLTLYAFKLTKWNKRVNIGTQIMIIGMNLLGATHHVVRELIFCWVKLTTKYLKLRYVTDLPKREFIRV